GIGTWLPTFNNEVLHLPQAMSVVAGSLYAGALAAGRIIGGAVIRKSGWFPVLLTCLVIVGAVILLIGPLSHTDRSHTVMDWAHAPLAAYLFLGIGFFMAPIYPTIVSVILSANPKSRHTALMGLVVVFSALGGTTDSRLTAELFRRIDGATAFTLMVVPVGLLLAGLILLRGQSRNYISK
ncbi:MAG: MFS transporter, partial [Alphaproteobacteria bacterium]|nr:MFS transporter [Alphaproteobacteria bacterium]